MKAVCLLNCSNQACPSLCVTNKNAVQGRFTLGQIVNFGINLAEEPPLHGFVNIPLSSSYSPYKLQIPHPGLQCTSDRVKSRQVRPNSAKKLSFDEISIGRHRQRFLRRNELAYLDNPSYDNSLHFQMEIPVCLICTVILASSRGMNKEIKMLGTLDEACKAISNQQPSLT